MLKKICKISLAFMYAATSLVMAFHEMVHCTCDESFAQTVVSSSGHHDHSGCSHHEKPAASDHDHSPCDAAGHGPDRDNPEHHEHTCELCDPIARHSETSLAFMTDMARLLAGPPISYEIEYYGKPVPAPTPGHHVSHPPDIPPSAHLEAVSFIVLIV